MTIPNGVCLGWLLLLPLTFGRLTMLCPTLMVAGAILHFDMVQPAFEQIGKYCGGIVLVAFRRIPCTKFGGIQFTSQSMAIPTSILSSLPMLVMQGMFTQYGLKGPEEVGSRCQEIGDRTGNMNGLSMSFIVTTSDGKTVISNNVAPGHLQFGQTFTGKQF
eukprot:c21129_g1_i2 orf=595-1077(+)